MQIKIHSGDIEVAVANLLDFRKYTIVPNVSWGLGLKHECDLLALDKNKRFTEIEIKISIQDLKKDFEKQHGHYSPYIGRLIYAIPVELIEKALPLIPKECGIITVKHQKYSKKNPFKADWYRQCKHRKGVSEIPNEMIEKFYHLGCMRIWSLKSYTYKLKRTKNGKI